MKVKTWTVFILCSGVMYTGYFIMMQYEKTQKLKNTRGFLKVSRSNITVHSEDVSVHKPSLVTIFTTFKSNATKIPVFNNTLYNWRHLADKKDVKLILFNGDDIHMSLRETAIKLGWILLDIPRMNKQGTPFLKDMFKIACKMYDSIYCGFCNGDILFGHGLKITIFEILQFAQVFRKILIIGKRTNVLVSNQTRLYVPKLVDVAAEKAGELDNNLAEDYFFIYKNDFPWEKLPDVVIGRLAYDNYIVRLALKNNLNVIDVTKTVNAVHQTDKDGTRTGHNANIPDRGYNKKLLGVFNSMTGSIICSQYITQFRGTNSSRILVDKRTNRPAVC